MAQHLLDAAEVGAFVQKMRGKRVAQRVGADRTACQAAGISCDDASHAPAGQASSALVAEQRIGHVAGSLCRQTGAIAPDRVQRDVSDRYNPLLSPFSLQT